MYFKNENQRLNTHAKPKSPYFEPLLKTFIFSLLLFSFETQASLFRVVIDPGHGGSDEGTVYQNESYSIAEKSVTLKIAKEVAQILKSKGHWVTLTRDKDQELALPARTAIANRLGADVFISLHMNSADAHQKSRRLKFSSKKHFNYSPEGIETFILNHTTDASSRRLAQLENSITYSVLPNRQSTSPEDTDVALILKDLRLDANLTESKNLACKIQSQLVHATSDPSDNSSGVALRRNRGVKQALFHVLLGADMPSVLVEVGFLSNSRDRSWVLSPTGLRKISSSIAEAIDQFKKEKNSRKSLLSLNNCKVH